MSLPIYSSRDVQVSFAGQAIEALAPDSFITFSLSVPITDTEVGADGKVSISYSPDETGTCTISVQQNSPSDVFLSSVLAGQRASRKLVIADIVINDPSGSVLAYLGSAHIQEAPEVSLGSTATGQSRDYQFFVEVLHFGAFGRQGLQGDIISGATTAARNILSQILT
jgi:hypothetical protein